MIESKAITVEQLRPRDSHETAVLLQSVISPLGYYSQDAKKAEIEKYTAVLLSAMAQEDPYSVLVAKSDEHIVGFCVSRYDDTTIWLCWIGTSPDLRKQGIAEKLLGELEKSAPLRGAHKIWCDCRTENRSSIALLTKLGYRQIAEVQRHWYGHDYFLWEKFL